MIRTCTIIHRLTKMVGIVGILLAVTGPARANEDSLCASELLPLIEPAYVSVEDALTRLSLLEEALLEIGDRRVIFVSVYVRMTGGIKEHIEANFFLDREWMTDLTVIFANFYRQALLDFECGRLDQVPQAWQLAFASARRGDAGVLQEAALGINAHINHDLALAIYQASLDPNRSIRHEDHKLVNDVLASVIDDVQDFLVEQYDPDLAGLDSRFGRLDEILFVGALRQWSERAWRSAVVLNDVPGARIYEFMRRRLDESSAATARRILRLRPRD